MRVFLFSQHFAPEDVSGARLASELAFGLAELGQRVCVITCAPSYPAGRVYTGYKNTFLKRETMQGVEVYRVWSYISPERTIGKRVLNQGSFSLAALYGGLAAARKGGKPDILFTYSQPLSLGVAGWFLSRLWKIPWILRVEDLQPEAAIAAGVIKNQTAIQFLYRIEKFLYERAAHVSLISEGFLENLREKGLPPQKLSITPVWANPEEVRPGPKENRFRDKHGLNGDFVILHAGNLGYNSNLEDALQAANALRQYPRIRFVIVGEGVKKEQLERDARQLGLQNVVFLPYQPRQDLCKMMAAADAGLVTLQAASAWSSLPSKAFTIMASGRPVLAVTPPDSELAQLVEAHGCGVHVNPGRPLALTKTILRMMDSPGALVRMGENGRRAVETVYNRQACVAAFARLIEDHAR